MARPKEYTEGVALEIAEKLPDMFRNGESVAEVCAELGMCKDTFYGLCKDHPKFSDAYKKGLQLSEAWWTKLGRAGAAGKVSIQPTTWIFNMKNRFNWADKIEQQSENTHTIKAPDLTIKVVKADGGDS